MIWAFLIGGEIYNPEITLTVPNYRLGISKNHKKRHIWKTAKFWAVIFGGKKIATPESTLTESDCIDGNFKFFEIFYTYVFWKKKKLKNVISRNLQKFEQPYSGADSQTPESTLTVSNNRIKIFKFLENFKI